MAFGSYIRFGIGLLMSIAVIWSFLGDSIVSPVLALLAVLYIILSALWFAFRF